MKLAYILPNIVGTGGIAKVIFAKINYLIEKLQYDITIITYDDMKLESVYYISDKVNFIELKLKNIKHLKHKLEEVLHQKKYDIVISSLSNNEFYFINEIKDGSKKIAEFHTCYNYMQGFTKRKYNFFKYLNEKINFYRFIRAAKKFDKFIVLNQIDEKKFSKHLNNVAVISNPIIVNSTLKSDFKTKKIIAAGRLEGVKGFSYLIDAWKILFEKHKDWELNIFGEGSLENELNQQITRLNLKNISIKPFDNDIDKEYIDSSIIVMTSQYEGQGMVLLEGMYYGLSLVSFKIESGPLELVKDNKNGYLVERNNVEDLAIKLSTLMENEKLREDFHHQSILLSEHYKIEAIIEKWNTLFKEL